VGAKLHWSKGKEPRSQVKVPKFMLSASEEVEFHRQWGCWLRSSHHWKKA